VAIIWQGAKRFVVNRRPPPPPPEELELQRQILDDLRSGITPSRVSAPGYFCKSGEKVLYVFNNVKYYRLKGHAHYVGGSRGVSVRIMKGVSYHVGAHRGHREVTQSMDFQGIGPLVVTNQAINLLVRHQAVYSSSTSSTSTGTKTASASILTPRPATVMRLAG
jgi:hypothetical protein